MNDEPPAVASSAFRWDLVRQRVPKGERSSKTRSMVLTNFRCVFPNFQYIFWCSWITLASIMLSCDWLAHDSCSGCVEDIAVENAEASRVTIMAPAKTASLPRNTQPQWPNLHGGSIVSGYLTNLDIVSLTSSDSFRFFPKRRAFLVSDLSRSISNRPVASVKIYRNVDV